MPDATVAAPAAASTEPTHFDSWDSEGTPIVAKKPDSPQPKPADTATADTSKGTKTDDAADSAAKKTQEPDGKRRADGGEDRFQKLTRESKTRIAQLERELEEARKPKTTQADPSPARQTEPAQTRGADKEPTPEDKNADGTPKFKSYEEYVKAQARWEARQEFAALQAEQARNETSRKFADAVSEARKSYQDFDTVAEPMAKQVNELILDPKVDGTLKKVLFDSDAVHILYALGSDPKLAESFGNLARTDPAEAIYLWKSLKAAVKKELSGTTEPPKAAPAKEEPPAAPKPRAPKPPSEVGGRGASGEDALVSAAKANDFRAFEAEQTRRAMASRR